MATLLAWKDILRPIRDGYRHFFPAPDTGPSPEERRKRREQDQLKGFTYFDTFEQLESWDATKVDLLQRANTPLLPRPAYAGVEALPKANVLLCHDYAGNYHDYESVQQMGLEDEIYACEYLQFVAILVYFSHKLVCVPPPTWTNTLHRNGVKSLGTILVEPQTKDTERLLQRTGANGSVTFGLARQLGNIAKYHGFDGFIVNIEKPFAKDEWDAHTLEAFLLQLKQELGDDRELIWYDALTVGNEVRYQNGLNLNNLPFARACGRLLTNYCWTEDQARDSVQIAAEYSMPLENVFFGIDVWAQNSTAFTHPRTTYPRLGGGGTNTGIAVAKLAELGLSAGVFAPAWSYEHFPGRGKEIERVMWEGEALPSDIYCSCGNPIFRHKTSGGCICPHSRLAPAGSETFFFTDFARAIASHSGDEREKVYSGHTRHSQIGSQAPLPLPSPLPSADEGRRPQLIHCFGGPAEEPSKVVISYRGCPANTFTRSEEMSFSIALYRFAMPADYSLRLTIKYQCLRKDIIDVTPSLYLEFTGHRQSLLLSSHESEGIHTIETRLGASSSAADTMARFEELGVDLQGFHGTGTVAILEIYSIGIAPEVHHNNPHQHSIQGIHIVHHGEGETRHVRLRWEHAENYERSVRDVPHSDVTGSFSHFIVRMDGMQIGRAYTREYILSSQLAEALADQEVEVEIIGVGFDGQTLACQKTTLGMGSG
ncbi:glycosyl hydrolase family 85-domain-containing protein [Ampelomyces quisqualis]|uniref:Glycosyl hydrolase family 85-domain-containing protein n=1 Tax=Ampelomyces quisqualis TaxID=50730 RepID=A0A6A5QQR4_AMPQU|nr:glycosyl hydrolase family 85-domain-containing protein [Ampelomyces quisqualis]